MRTLRLLLPAALLALAACSPFRSGRSHYREGMQTIAYDPQAALEDFAEADRRLAEALADPDLDPARRVTAVSIRARALIELDRHREVPPLVKPAPEGYHPDRLYEGDLAGLALIKAGALDPERAYAELLLAEKRANTLKARLHIAWEQTRLLELMGTPRAKTEALKLCAQHAGKLDFDEIRKRLE